MKNSGHKAIAVVGVGAILPQAPNAQAFWKNIKEGRYSITDVQPDRWDPNLYYDPDPKVPDKSYSKIGGWVRDWEWDPLKWKLPIPPRVSDVMDLTQIWAVAAAREVLNDYGYPNKPLNSERTAVILGNAMGGDTHLFTASRILFPEYEKEITTAKSFKDLSPELRGKILKEIRDRVDKRYPQITEDTMPGELSNIVSGRIAALYNFRGPNYVTDAACASAMAGMNAAIHGLEENDFDAVITGGIDANMSASTYVKFCKIGALSATGTRPYADGADGFVMGEGAALFLLKRLEDAEQDGDKIYAVIRGIGGSSDGKGKGITAPNPIGQKLAVQRGWENAGLSPETATLIEGHGTSTKVGDVAELESLFEVFNQYHLPAKSIPLGSVKSNIGHLKGAAGAAGILKTVFALYEKAIPPSLNFDKPNPNIDFETSPFYVNTELKPWEDTRDGIRRAGVSAFGFGGTNFHTVLEEYIPGRIQHEKKVTVAGEDIPQPSVTNITSKQPLRGALVIGAETESGLLQQLNQLQNEVRNGSSLPIAPPSQESLRSRIRLAIDYENNDELADKIARTVKAIQGDKPAAWRALRAKGVFLGRGESPKLAFLYTGQGSQYANMLKDLKEREKIVADAFVEADEVMTPILGKPLTELIFVDGADEKAVADAEKNLRQTSITQPAVLTIDLALTRLFASYGIKPDMVMGHSLGEYGGLVASGALSFAEGLKAVSLRGAEMSKVSVADNGLMAAAFGPLDEIEKIIADVDGYVSIANINSYKQVVIGGATKAVEEAVAKIRDAGYTAQQLPVSHAFHTKIVAPASVPMGQILSKMNLQSPQIPLISNVTGDFYPIGPDVKPEMVKLLSRQIAEPVQFVKGLNTLYEAGARVFVEMGPKRALHGFTEDVLGSKDDVLALSTNHPRVGDIPSFNQALCGLYASGFGFGTSATKPERSIEIKTEQLIQRGQEVLETSPPSFKEEIPAAVQPQPGGRMDKDAYLQLGQMFADFLEKGFEVYSGKKNKPTVSKAIPERVGITGASIGLPGKEKVFDEANIEKILNGEQFIGKIPVQLRQAMIDKNITRVVKDSDGGGRFETIDKVSDAIKLAARRMSFDLSEEFGYPKDRLLALDIVSQLAIAAGVDGLRDAGIPLVMHYKTTTMGTKLPDKWGLPEYMRDDTGVIFGSAFPGQDSLAEIISSYYKYRIRHDRLEDLKSLRIKLSKNGSGAKEAIGEIDEKIQSLEKELEQNNYTFDRRFLFRVLSMGHSQFAEYIGARGPNTQINGACASGTQGIALAQDWIQAGRCRRVIVISADDITGDNSIEWFGAGFLASGAAATDEDVEDAAIPFDRRRHGLIIGMGSAAVVVESLSSAQERGIQPICEVLNSVIANSAFHGSRLDVNHICGVMEKLVSEAEQKWGIDRRQIAPQTVFVSHETYTPARGGSASAEVYALRHVFGEAADNIVVANTKGYTGHPMGVGVEDVVAIKILETGIVPPVANFKEVDPELGMLNLSKGGKYPVQYAMRLGAGFGSQISMMLIKLIPAKDGQRRSPKELGFDYRIADQNAWHNWLNRISGYENAELEIVKRTLRVKDKGPVKEAVKPLVARPQIEQPKEEPTAAPATPQPEIMVQPAAIGDEVQEKVLQIIAEQTGYPTDMLDLDLDLEADLGIDTVKQAEMFAAIREAYGIPRDDNLKLRDFPTLKHTIQFVYDRRPDLKSAQSAEAAKPAEPAPAKEVAAADQSMEETVKTKLLEIVSEQTGYPIDMLDLDLDLEADLGIDTVKQAEMFAAIRAAYDIPRDDNLKLRDFPTLKHSIQFVFDHRPDLKGAESSELASVQSVPKAKPEVTTSIDESVSDNEPVKQKILEIISEQTGYPIDMLDLELDLEADLGIDTVKQAEMFAAIRAAYDIPRDDNLKLRDFPTLAHSIQFVYDRRPDLKPAAKKQAVMESPPKPEPEASTRAEAGGDDDPVKKKILEIISEQTGYPEDMLDPELDLEADLGIDTVKQAEMFAAIRAAYDIPRDDNLKLRDYPTLAHAIQFVHDRRPDLKGGKLAAEKAAEDVKGKLEEKAQTGKEIKGDLEAANQIPRRVPIPQLRPSLDLCKSTGVILDSKSRVVVMMDKGGVGKALLKRLQELKAEALVIDQETDSAKLTGQINDWLKAGSIQGIFWLPALDAAGSIFKMDEKAWKSAVQARVKLLYTAMRALYNQINKRGAFLISATRLGGQHGYDDKGAVAPLGGAVAGFTKAYKREQNEALVKVVDFELSKKTTSFAELLIQETVFDPGVVEVGYKNEKRWTIGFEEKPIGEIKPAIELNKNSVFLVTGAAGSIVSAIVSDLASASGGTFHLVDLVPKPDPNNSDIKRFVNDKENLKKDIFQRLKETEERATPAMVEKELAKIERARAALSAIQAVENAGGTAYYHSVNLLDKKAVEKVIEDIRKKNGKIDALIHAGGLEISRLLPDKEPQEFNLVFDVKSEGWFNILSSIGDMPLKNAVVFSSIAGRFGNGGQTDYSAANDFLCKSISSFRNNHPQTRGMALDWTAWGGIGMATRGSIPTIMKQAGIDMLPPEAGIPMVRRELTSAGEGCEIIVAQRLGIMLNEFDASGGLDTGSGSKVDKLLKSRGVMVGKITGMGLYSGLTVETELDPSKQPFLFDHQINDTPVMPGVMGIEALVEAAKAIFPDLHVSAIENVNFSSPFKFYRKEPRVVTVQAHFGQDGKNIVANCRLIGTRKLHGQDESQETTHFTADVKLSDNQPDTVKKSIPKISKSARATAKDIYKLYFHGPAYQVMDSSWRSGKNVIGLMAKQLPANHEPIDLPTLVSPRLIELCFQTAGIWEMGMKEKMGLPYHIDSLKIFRNGDTKRSGKIFAVVTPSKDDSFAAYVVDEKGAVYLQLQGYATMELPEPLEKERLKPLKVAMEDGSSRKSKK